MKKGSKKAKSEQRKFAKSYSLSTAAIHAIALAAKEGKRNPSDFLDFYVLETFGRLLPAQQ